MTEIKGEAINLNLIESLENEHFRCYRDKENELLVCETLVSYIPVESFIDFFERMGEEIEKHKIKKFIFDKRSLRAFHQPTMEWYFVEWKQKMRGSGKSINPERQS